MSFMRDVRIGLSVGLALISVIAVAMVVYGGVLEGEVVSVGSEGTTFRATWSQGCTDFNIGPNSCAGTLPYFCDVDSTGGFDSEPRCDICDCPANAECLGSGACVSCVNPCDDATCSGCTPVGDFCDGNYQCDPETIGYFKGTVNYREYVYQLSGIQVAGQSTATTEDDQYESCTTETFDGCGLSRDAEFRGGRIGHIDRDSTSFCGSGVACQLCPGMPAADYPNGDQEGLATAMVYPSGNCEDRDPPPPDDGDGGEDCACKPCGTCQDPTVDSSYPYYIESCELCGELCFEDPALC